MDTGEQNAASEQLEDVEDLTEIMSNVHLNNNFLALAREVRLCSEKKEKQTFPHVPAMQTFLSLLYHYTCTYFPLFLSCLTLLLPLLFPLCLLHTYTSQYSVSYTHTPVSTLSLTHIYTPVSGCVCVFGQMHMNMYMYVHVRTCIYMYIRVCTSMQCWYIRTCIFLFIDSYNTIITVRKHNYCLTTDLLRVYLLCVLE